MAGNQQNSRKVASLIVILAVWFLISACDLKHILGNFLAPRLRKARATSQLQTKALERGNIGCFIYIFMPHVLL
jgi:hypothetical protein